MNNYESIIIETIGWSAFALTFVVYAFVRFMEKQMKQQPEKKKLPIMNQLHRF